MKKICFLIICMIPSFAFSDVPNYWTVVPNPHPQLALWREPNKPHTFTVYILDKEKLYESVKKSFSKSKKTIQLNLPNPKGEMEIFDLVLSDDHVNPNPSVSNIYTLEGHLSRNKSIEIRMNVDVSYVAAEIFAPNRNESYRIRTVDQVSGRYIVHYSDEVTATDHGSSSNTFAHLGTGRSIAFAKFDPDKMIVLGSLAKEYVVKVVAAYFGRIQACYESELKKFPKLAGTLSATFTISGSGTVTSSATKESTFKNTKVGTCINVAIKRIPFSASSLGDTEVTVPFQFAPRN